MKISRPSFPQVFFRNLSLAATFLVFASFAGAQQPAPQQSASRYDVTNYRIEAQLIPDQHVLRAGAEVTFTPLDATRSVVFELNGALKVEKIERNGKALTNFVQDAAGTDPSHGPNDRTDPGDDGPVRQ